MSTTVRIRPEDKARLDRLQARILLETGRRVSLDGVLHRMLEVAARHEDEVVRDDGSAPLITPAQKARLLALPYDYGSETSEDTIDDEIYGGDMV